MEKITTNLTIRKATCEDLDLLLAWRKSMFLDMGKSDNSLIATSLARFTSWFSQELNDSERLCAFIGEVDKSPVACAVVFVHDWFPTAFDPSTQRGYILNVYTLPEWRRNGFAGQLIRACLDWLREKGIRTVSLHASTQGQSVYAKEGFKHPGSLEMILHMDYEL